MTPLTVAELRALVSLLDDRTPAVANRCRARLFAEGERAVPALRELAGGESGSPAAAAALVALRDHLVDEELRGFAAAPPADLDLEVGAILLARTRTPGVSPAAVRADLDALAEEVQPALSAVGGEPAGLARAFAEVLFGRHGFTGNRADYYDPDNSYLDQVLVRRRGIPISLSAVYLLVARRVGAPLDGVGVPGHFVVRCGGDDGVFVDPFRDGRILTRDDCRGLLRASGFATDESLLDPLPDRYILARMIANLVHVYRRRSDRPRAERLRRHFVRVRGEPVA